MAGRFDEAKTLAQINRIFGADPEAEARDPEDLHRRADAGRRALGHPAARRRRAGARGGVPRALGTASGLRRRRPARPGHGRHAVGPPLQGARRDEEGDVGRRLLPLPPRPRLPDVPGAGAEGRVARGRAEDDARHDRRRRDDTDHEGRGRTRAHGDAEEHRPDAQFRRPRRARALRVDRRRRLAALLPQSRPRQEADRGGRAARRGGVSQAVQPHRRALHPDREARPRRRPAIAGRRGDAQGLQGRGRGGAGRGLRSLARQHRVAHDPHEARRAACRWRSCPRRRAAGPSSRR